ncbi:MAG: hypothetical protein AABZ57_02725, partial [Candidatus Margulisiibacteriota bacterium]
MAGEIKVFVEGGAGDVGRSFLKSPAYSGQQNLFNNIFNITAIVRNPVKDRFRLANDHFYNNIFSSVSHAEENGVNIVYLNGIRVEVRSQEILNQPLADGGIGIYV